MSVLDICLFVNYMFCLLSILGMIFFEHKKPIRITAWSLVLIILPFLGLLLYILIGYGLGYKTKKFMKKRVLMNKRYEESLKKQISILKHDASYSNKKYKDLILMNLKNSNAIFSDDNKVTYFSSGNKMLESLKKDLLNAKKTINLMFYIFANDSTGKQIRDILIQKAQQGVKVKVLYDAIGSLKTHKFNFKKLVKAGGEVEEFFPAFMGLKLFNFKANYRNHRKIVVIDGKVAYTGGMNLRDDHMGLKKKVSPWRDCHLKIQGSAVYSLQNIFISDWRISKKKIESEDYYLNSDYYDPIKASDGVPMQVVSSGPTELDERNIEELMIKMIMLAKRVIKIESPYFVLDDEFRNALKIALLCGVKIEIVVPQKPDKWFVYCATLEYLKELQSLGAKIYLYKGFIHTKALSIDDEVLTIGSCNIDIRSFALNFEVNSVIYDNQYISEYLKNFDDDKTNSNKVDKDFFKKLSPIQKLVMSISKLFSAIL